MKSKDFASFLESFSDVLRDAGLQQHADAWSSLASVFAVKPELKTVQALKVLGTVRYAEPSTGLRVAEIQSYLPSLERLVTQIAKKDVIEDFHSLRMTLKGVSSATVSALVVAARLRLLEAPAKKPGAKSKIASLREDVVTRHLAELQRALGDDSAFKLALAALKADPEATAAELKALSKRFAGETASSKPKALSYILRHHSAIMESRDKDAATGGRTAANSASWH